MILNILILLIISTGMADSHSSGDAKHIEHEEEGWIYIKKAADLGHADASYLLGQHLLETHQESEGWNYIKKACELKHAEACFKLGQNMIKQKPEKDQDELNYQAYRKLFEYDLPKS